MATFKAFKPEAMQRIARSMGHMGDMNQFENFLMANPDKSAMMRNYNARAMQMAEGGVVKKMQEGGDTGTGTEEEKKDDTTTQPTTDQNTQVQLILIIYWTLKVELLEMERHLLPIKIHKALWILPLIKYKNQKQERVLQ